MPNICFVLPRNLKRIRTICVPLMKFKVLVAADNDYGIWNHRTKIISLSFILSSNLAVLSQTQQRPGVLASRGIIDSL